VAVVFNSANTGSWRIVRPGIDHIKCSRCGTCIMFCPTNVMELKDKKDIKEIKDKTDKTIEIDWKYCKGCGICANVCPKKCITMIEEGDNESR
jgi:pyruvate ferredoxin oxidoreductase delta subunit